MVLGGQHGRPDPSAQLFVLGGAEQEEEGQAGPHEEVPPEVEPEDQEQEEHEKKTEMEATRALLSLGLHPPSDDSNPHGHSRNHHKRRAPSIRPRKSSKLIKSSSSRWTKEEDEKLRQGVEEYGSQEWGRISLEFFQGRRSEAHCSQRWEKMIKPGIKSGPWTPEEDRILVQCINEGITKWSEIAKRIPGRLSKRVRERWTCQLNPARLKKEASPWTPEEEDTLFEAQQRLGNKWVEIAKLLPGRSENDVKNRAYCESRKRARKEAKLNELMNSEKVTTKVTRVFNLFKEAAADNDRDDDDDDQDEDEGAYEDKIVPL